MLGLLLAFNDVSNGKFFFIFLFVGLTQTAIAVISSTVFFVLVVISGVVLFKAGFFSRERKRITNTKLTTEINLSDQTVPLQDGDSVWIESSL